MAFSVDGNKKSGKKIIKKGARLLSGKVAKVLPFMLKNRFT